jgi:hypothetical protein
MPRESTYEFALLRLAIFACTNVDTRGNKEELSVRRRRNLIQNVAAEVKAYFLLSPILAAGVIKWSHLAQVFADINPQASKTSTKAFSKFSK